MTTPCERPIPFQDLIAYHLRELDEVEGDRLATHYFACAHCTERLELVAQLGEGVRSLIQTGRVLVGSTMALVERARTLRIAVREYRTDPDQHVLCTAGPDDVFLVTRYGGLAGVTSVDVHFRGAIVGTDQTIEMELPDTPVDQSTGDLVLVAPGALNRSLPPVDIEIRLTVNGPDGPREAGPYHYHHVPWGLLDEDQRQRRAGR